MMNQQKLKFGDVLEQYQISLYQFETFLMDELGFTDWSTISYNDDNCVYHISDVENNNRISPEGYTKLVSRHNIHYLTLRHKDGTVTNYPSGFRQKYNIETGRYTTNQKVDWAEYKEDL